MEESPLLVEVAEGVAEVTINREARRNALNRAILMDLDDFLSQTAGDDVKVIIVKGKGTAAFSSGSDLSEDATLSRSETLELVKLGHRVISQLEEHPALVVAAIEGYCLGGGLELALGCDLRIAGSGSTFGLPEVALNFLPTWGGDYRLARVVGMGRAKEMVLFNRRLAAEEALAWGLISEVVPVGQAALRARELTASLVRIDGDTIALAKALASATWGASTAMANRLEFLAEASHFGTEAHRQGMAKFERTAAPDS